MNTHTKDIQIRLTLRQAKAVAAVLRELHVTVDSNPDIHAAELAIQNAVIRQIAKKAVTS